MDDITIKRIFKEFDKLNEKQDAQSEILAALNVVTAKQEVNLQEHMRRTELLEQEVLPIKSHVEQVRGVGKFLAFLAVIGGAIAAFLAID